MSGPTVTARMRVTILRRSTVLHGAGIENGNDRRHRDGESDLLGEPAPDIQRIASRDLEMGRVRIVHPQHVVTDPDRRSVVMLGVDCVDAAWPDDEMVDVFRIGPDRHRVANKPVGPQAAEHLSDAHLAEGTLVPGPCVRVQRDALVCPQSGVSLFGLGLDLQALQRDSVSGWPRGERADAREVHVRDRFRRGRG